MKKKILLTALSILGATAFLASCSDEKEAKYYKYIAPCEINDYYMLNNSGICIKIFIKSKTDKYCIFNSFYENPQFEFTSDEQYLEVINNKNYIVLMSAKDDASYGMTSSFMNKLKSLGVSFDYNNAFRKGYYAIVDGNDTLSGIVDSSSDSIEQEGILSGTETKYYIYSSGYDSTNKSAIIIDDIDYSLNKRGLNIVVYDKKQKKVINSSCFDICDNCKRINE